MLSKHLLGFVIICVAISACSRLNYKVMSLDNTEFIIPPSSKLGLVGLFNSAGSFQYNSRFRFHRVYFEATDIVQLKSYAYFLSVIDMAKYEYSDSTLTKPHLDKLFNRSGYAEIKVDSAANLYFSNENNKFMLELDYNPIMDENPVVYFKSLYPKLLEAFRQKETAAPHWPSTICQDIVSKIYELLPMPVESTLAGLGLVQNSEYSLLLLHPRIALRVDHTVFDNRTTIADIEAINSYFESLIDQADQSKSETMSININDIKALKRSIWYKYTMTGQSIIPLYKVQNKKGEVFFKQNSFLHSDLDRTLLFDNLYRETVVHQGSSTDIELSARISTSPFLFLYQKYLGGNNSGSTRPSSTIGNCCRFGNGAHCTSLILFRQNHLELSAPFDYCNTQITDYASFGEHSVIVPVIAVYINGHLTYQPLGHKLADLVEGGLVTKMNKFERIAGTSYRPVKKKTDNIWLLPGDRVINL